MESGASAITVAGIFETAGDVMSGFVTMTGNFFTSLWAVPMGKIVIGLGLVSGAVGLAYKLFLRRKHV